jgi:hypothetical protein
LRPIYGEKDEFVTRMDDLRRGGTRFDPFLYASVGEDRNGNRVTVLSALARLGFEPWGAAAELADLKREDARTRFEAILGRFNDVPALGRDRETVTLRLLSLLPQSSGGQADQGENVAAPAGAKRMDLILASLMVVVFVMQVFFAG